MFLVVNLLSSTSLILWVMTVTTSAVELARRHPYWLLLRMLFLLRRSTTLLLITDSKGFLMSLMGRYCDRQEQTHAFKKKKKKTRYTVEIFYGVWKYLSFGWLVLPELEIILRFIGNHWEFIWTGCSFRVKASDKSGNIPCRVLKDGRISRNIKQTAWSDRKEVSTSETKRNLLWRNFFPAGGSIQINLLRPGKTFTEQQLINCFLWITHSNRKKWYEKNSTGDFAHVTVRQQLQEVPPCVADSLSVISAVLLFRLQSLPHRRKSGFPEPFL